MDSTLLIGPRHQALESRAFDLADDLVGDGLGSVLYVTRNDARRSDVEDAWAKDHRPLRLRAETLDAVVLEWHEKLAGPVDRLSGQLNRRLAEYALDEATTDGEGALSGEPASAALADAFSSRFSLFDEAGLATADELASEFDESLLDERIAEATVSAYRHYNDLRSKSVDDWTLTRGELVRTVLESERSLAALSPEVDVVIISGFYEFRPVERALFERITDAFDTIAVLPRHQPGTASVDAVTTEALDVYADLGYEFEGVADSTTLTDITAEMYQPNPDIVSAGDWLVWRELPTPEREIRFVARELRSELAAGRDPDELAVVIPGVDTYAGYVEDVFDTFEVPYAMTAASQLNRTFAGSVVHDLLALAEPDPRAEELTSLLANPLTSVLPAARANAITAETRRRETVSLESVLHTVDQDTSRPMNELLETLQGLRTDDVDVAVATLRRLLTDELGVKEAIDEYATGAERKLEERAYALIEEVFDSFETMSPLDTELSPLALLTRAFDGIPLRVPHRGAGGSVPVMGMLDARMRAFEKVFVVGLTAGQFPSIPNRPAFFEEMTDAHPELDTGDEQLRGRYLFATLLANVDAVTLTTPKSGAGDDAIVRSPVLDELQRVTEIEPVEGIDERISSHEDSYRYIADCHDPHTAIDHFAERDVLSTAQTTRLARGFECADNRSQATFTPHDAILEAETVRKVYPSSAREPYSASRLERYVECGFKFYAENVLGLEEPDDVSVTPDPLETGSYVHDVFERFYADLHADADDEVDLAAYDREELETHLLEVAFDELEQADFAYEGVFYERWLTELFAGLGDTDTNPYVVSHRPHEAPEHGLFASFLDTELDRSGDSQPTWFERPFGEGLPDPDTVPFEVERPDGSSIAVRGYIDRVDVATTDESERLTLYDYKTGRVPYMTTTTGGTTFQLPIYLLAADAVLGNGEFDEAALSATYYQARPPNDVRVLRGIESKFDSQAELRRFLTDVVPEWLGTIDDAIANGRFHTTLLSDREANCTYCEYRRVCDVRHHRKRDTIDVARDEEATYVPLRVQDERDLEEVMADD
ncbi:PD-(D/E)XK nuclease family protein [Saliphagus sp. GCM10025334]